MCNTAADPRFMWYLLLTFPTEEHISYCSTLALLFILINKWHGLFIVNTYYDSHYLVLQIHIQQYSTMKNPIKWPKSSQRDMTRKEEIELYSVNQIQSTCELFLTVGNKSLMQGWWGGASSGGGCRNVSRVRSNLQKSRQLEKDITYFPADISYPTTYYCLYHKDMKSKDIIFYLYQIYLHIYETFVQQKTPIKIDYNQRFRLKGDMPGTRTVTTRTSQFSYFLPMHFFFS